MKVILLQDIKNVGKKGDVVDVALMCTEAKARAFRPGDEELNSDLDESAAFLGINKKYEATFPNIEMNTVPDTQSLYEKDPKQTLIMICDVLTSIIATIDTVSSFILILFLVFFSFTEYDCCYA